MVQKVLGKSEISKETKNKEEAKTKKDAVVTGVVAVVAHAASSYTCSKE